MAVDSGRTAPLSELATGTVELIMDQKEIARAVEFWLNERVLKMPCSVANLKSAVVNSSATFTVLLRERKVEGDADEQQE